MAALSETLRRLVGKDFEKRRYLLAVSGGLDSMALFHLAIEALEPTQIVVAHFHHGTRKSAERDLELVKHVAEKAGVEFVFARRAPTKKKVSELTLREARRFFLEAVRVETKCDYILTAHHLNDQFETLLMRIMRGTGAKGLSGIKERNGRYLRPLLSLTKQDIQIYAEVNEIGWNEDESNRDVHYLRNRVRHEVVPAFLKAAESLGSEGQILSRWNETAKELEQLTRSNHRKLVKLLSHTPYWTRLSEKNWKRLQSKEKRQLIGYLAGEPLTRPSLERILEAMEERCKRFDLTCGVESVFSCGHWFVSTKDQRRKLQRRGAPNIFQVISPEFQARYFRPGDRLGKTKLKKLFLEAKIPKPERRLVPIVLDKNGQIVGFYPKTDLVKCSFPFSFME